MGSACISRTRKRYRALFTMDDLPPTQFCLLRSSFMVFTTAGLPPSPIPFFDIKFLRQVNISPCAARSLSSSTLYVRCTTYHQVWALHPFLPPRCGLGWPARLTFPSSTTFSPERHWATDSYMKDLKKYRTFETGHLLTPVHAAGTLLDTIQTTSPHNGL